MNFKKVITCSIGTCLVLGLSEYYKHNYCPPHGSCFWRAYRVDENSKQVWPPKGHNLNYRKAKIEYDRCIKENPTMLYELNESTPTIEGSLYPTVVGTYGNYTIYKHKPQE